MRHLQRKEVRQRGCDYCKDRKGYSRCPYEKCPYHALDRYPTFEEWYKAQPVIDTRELFKDI